MIIHRLTKLKILVMSYTNHATDQFIADLREIGIPEADIVRLGGRASEDTAIMSLANKHTTHRRSQASWQIINDLKSQQSELRDTITELFGHYSSYKVSFEMIMEYLEFSDDDSHFFDAFSLPADLHGWRQIGKRGKQLEVDYLWARWLRGEGPGVLAKEVPCHAESVWDMQKLARHQCRDKWLKVLLAERVEALCNLIEKYDENQTRLDNLFKDKTEAMRSSRIIACTTTGAAIFANQIREVRPDFVIFEEAGEILECHTLTALRDSVSQVVMIGDHKQLRPKVNDYKLTVEKGNGYDFNRSMFERLILTNFPHITLQAQHRMHPQISLFARALTYPDLQDGPRTTKREAIRGLQDRVIFINHEQEETDMLQLVDRRDPTQKGSKENKHEALMVLRIVRYLAQQGYGTENMVVLTPYLGQLRLLRDQLQAENDPILNDLDASTLLQAGLLTAAATKVKKRSLRLATIDNYQGEESDIVIASLTRGNDRGDIGFMSAPERLNVLITRPRSCLVLIGNMETFQKSKGREIWCKFFDLLRQHQHLYDGLPIVCHRHPERKKSLASPADFDASCPDGGCAEPCGALLTCKTHQCPRRCHRESDHKHMQCGAIVKKKCDRGHQTETICHALNDLCRTCVKEDADRERKRRQQEEMVKRDLELEKARLQRQENYRRELKAMDDEILHQRRQMQNMDEEEQEKKILAQKQQDLKDIVATHQRLKLQKEKRERQKGSQTCSGTENSGTDAAVANDNDEFSPPDGAQKEWAHLKRYEAAQSNELDELMSMIGLESVKAEFLAIKNTVDTKLRQDVSLATQRFSCSLLGNPGTGKAHA